MLEKVTYTTLFVTDQNNALEFYTKKLGFELRGDYPTPNAPRFLSVGLKGQPLNVILWPGTKGASAPPHGQSAMFVGTKHVEATFKALKAKGVKFEEAHPVSTPWGKFVTALDPDGNRISIRQPS